MGRLRGERHAELLDRAESAAVQASTSTARGAASPGDATGWSVSGWTTVSSERQSSRCESTTRMAPVVGSARLGFLRRSW